MSAFVKDITRIKQKIGELGASDVSFSAQTVVNGMLKVDFFENERLEPQDFDITIGEAQDVIDMVHNLVLLYGLNTLIEAEVLMLKKRKGWFKMKFLSLR